MTRLIIFVVMFLMNPFFVRADWLGLMQNQGGSNEIDEPLDSRDIDLAFDKDNNAVCVITQKIGSSYRLLETHQTSGGNIWVPQGTIPIDNRLLVSGSKQPYLDIARDNTGLCVFAQDTQNGGSPTNAIFLDDYQSVFSIVNTSLPISSYTTDADQPAGIVSGSVRILTYVQAPLAGLSRIRSSKWENNVCSYWGSTGWSTIPNTAIPIDGADGTISSNPHMAMSSTGDIYCVFGKGSTSVQGIYAARYNNGQWFFWGVGGWLPSTSTGASMAIDGTHPNFDASYPRIVPLSSGKMLCVYVLNNKSDSTTRIHTSLFDGQNWNVDPSGTEADVAGGTLSAYFPDIAASSQGKVICVYAKSNTTDANNHAYASEWDGSQWLSMNAGKSLDVLGNSVTSMTPKLAFDSLGNAIAVFQIWKPLEAPGGRARIMANYFQGPPQVTGIAPDSGNINSLVTVTVDGFNFAGGATPAQRVKVWLEQTGHPVIQGSNIIVENPGNNFFTARRFTVDFDLNGATVGDWDLVVENPDGQRFVLHHIFGITWPDLNQAYVYPNPIRFQGNGPQGANALRFYNLTRVATIRIYTLDGVLVKTLEKSDRQLYVDWNLRNETGSLVAPGVYFYRLDTPDSNRVKGKFMVIH